MTCLVEGLWWVGGGLLALVGLVSIGLAGLTLWHRLSTKDCRCEEEHG